MSMLENAIARRATVEDIVRHRDRALVLYAEAHTAIAAASAALVDAAKEGKRASPETSRYNYHQEGKQEQFLRGIKTPERDAFLTDARKMIDTDVWAHVIKITALETLMDKKAKDQLNQELLTNPPEATVDNIMATLQQFMADADTIFKRGIAECFSALDRRFKSHDGWKIGGRVVLTRAFDEHGHWSYHSNQRDTIRDIERTFLVLDGKKPGEYGGLVEQVDKDRGRTWGRRQGFTETEYFRVRSFMNGNAHVWFKRDDLLQRVNQLLGEYYGDAIPEEREPDADTGLHNPKTSLAKNYGFFPTPDAAAQEVIEAASLYHCNHCKGGDAPLRVLEPSAGTGNLARLARDKGHEVTCVEVHHERAAELARQSYAAVHECDFLALQPETLGAGYDRALLNPPFDLDRDIDHVMHALKFLKPDGKLVAIMSAGTEFRETRKATAFRELMTKMHANFRDLPAGSFSSVGTNINTVLLTVWKDGRQHWR